MDVYLLETKYKDGAAYEEFFLHAEGTDIWITDTGYFDEELENVMFTQLFWDRQGEEHLLTKLGTL